MKPTWSKVYGPPFDPARQAARERFNLSLEYSCVLKTPVRHYILKSKRYTIRLPVFWVKNFSKPPKR